MNSKMLRVLTSKVTASKETFPENTQLKLFVLSFRMMLCEYLLQCGLSITHV